MRAPTVTSLATPRLASLSAARAQIVASSRSAAFVVDGTRLLRAWGDPERPWVLAVAPDGARWKVEAWGAGPVEARAAARALFSLDHPIEEFYAQVRTEPALRGTDRRFRGLRIPRDPTVYEALLRSIVGQQLSVASASALWKRLGERTEARVRAGPHEVPTVPPPSAIARLGEDELRALGTSRVKARSLVGIAAARFSTDLAAAELPDAVERLSQLYGVGRWTAETALLRGVGRRDVFVAGDLAVRVALAAYAALPRAAAETEARAWAERRYPGWGGYATLYLWRRLVEDRVGRSAD